MARAADVVADLLAGYHIAEDIRARRIVTEWRAIVGARIAAHTWPGRLVDQTLWVRVSSSAWLHELSFMQEQLVDRIRRALGDPPVVARLRLHIARPRAVDDEDAAAIRAHEARARRPVAPRRPYPRPAEGRRLDAIRAEVASVDDPELRAQILAVRRKLDL